MDPGEECFMEGTAGAKALRLETQCERGGDEQRGDGGRWWGEPYGGLGSSLE